MSACERNSLPWMGYVRLKCDPQPFRAVMWGEKKCEIRLNDRFYHEGMGLLLEETLYTAAEMKAGKPLQYTGRVVPVRVTHVLEGYGLQDGFVALSILRVYP